MIGKRGVLGVPGAAYMGGDPLAASEDFHGPRGQAHLDLGAGMAIGDRVEVTGDFDVVVEPDLANPPLRQDVRFGRQELQPRLIELFEQLSAGATNIAEHALFVQSREELGYGGVHLGQAVEPTVAKPPQEPALHDPDQSFDLGLVTRLARTRRQNGGVVVLRHLRIGAVYLRVVEAGLDHRDLGVVGHDEFGRAAEVGEGLDVTFDPVDQLLAPAGVGERQTGGAHHRHEDVGLVDAPACRVHHHRHGVAGVIHEHLLAARMRLAHGHRQAGFPAAVELTPTAIAVAVRVGLDILVPKDLQCDVLALQLPVHRRPVRLRATTVALPPPSLPVEARLKLSVR